MFGIVVFKLTSVPDGADEMQKTKLDVLIAMFAYAGNGGVATVLPEIAMWLAKNSPGIGSDERVGRLAVKK